MNWVRFILVGLIILLAFAGAFTCFLPGRVSVSRDLHISARPETVERFIADTTGWDRWCVWPAGEAPLRATLVQVQPGDVRVDYRFRRLLPASGGFTLTEDDLGGTRVQWTLNFRMRWYPWEKLSGVLMDKVWGTPMDSSLERLKALLTR